MLDLNSLLDFSQTSTLLIWGAIGFLVWSKWDEIQVWLNKNKVVERVKDAADDIRDSFNSSVPANKDEENVQKVMDLVMKLDKEESEYLLSNVMPKLVEKVRNKSE